MDENKMAEKMHFMEFNDKNFFVGSSAGPRVAEDGGGLVSPSVYTAVHSVQ